MELLEMLALGNQLIDQHGPLYRELDNVRLICQILQNPDALIFTARQAGTAERPARAGLVHISKNALDDDPQAAVEGLTFLTARVRSETLPVCPVGSPAPLLAIRDSEGLRVMREGDSLPF